MGKEEDMKSIENVGNKKYPISEFTWSQSV